MISKKLSLYRQHFYLRGGGGKNFYFHMYRMPASFNNNISTDMNK